jgi:hypothetical protein
MSIKSQGCSNSSGRCCCKVSHIAEGRHCARRLSCCEASMLRWAVMPRFWNSVIVCTSFYWRGLVQTCGREQYFRGQLFYRLASNKGAEITGYHFGIRSCDWRALTSPVRMPTLKREIRLAVRGGRSLFVLTYSVLHVLNLGTEAVCVHLS